MTINEKHESILAPRLRGDARWQRRAAWLSWLSVSVLLVWGALLYRWQTQHPSGWTPGVLLLVNLMAAGVVLFLGVWRVVFGPERRRAFAVMVWGTFPTLLLLAGSVTLWWVASNRYFPCNIVVNTLTALAASLGDLERMARYPQRVEGERVIMFHQGIPNAAGQVAAADKHLAQLEEALGRKSVAKAHWIRGKIIGRDNYQFLGLAMSSPQDTSGKSDPLRNLDRHELAHFAIGQFGTGDASPPFVLSEGWAERMAGSTSVELARASLESDLPRLTLMELISDDWYYTDNGPVYSQGGIIVDYIIRRYSGTKFLELYTQCRQLTFASDLRRILGVTVEELDRDIGREIERLVAEPPAGVETSALPVPPKFVVSHSAWKNFRNAELGRGVTPSEWRQFFGEWLSGWRDVELPRGRIVGVTKLSYSNNDQPKKTETFTREYARDGKKRAWISKGQSHEKVMLLGEAYNWAGWRSQPGATWNHTVPWFEPESLSRRYSLSSWHSLLRAELSPECIFLNQMYPFTKLRLVGFQRANELPEQVHLRFDDAREPTTNTMQLDVSLARTGEWRIESLSMRRTNGLYRLAKEIVFQYDGRNGDLQSVKVSDDHETFKGTGKPGRYSSLSETMFTRESSVTLNPAIFDPASYVPLKPTRPWSGVPLAVCVVDGLAIAWMLLAMATALPGIIQKVS